MTDPVRFPLLTAWNIPIHESDPYGLEAQTVADATLPDRLSSAFDAARSNVPALRLRPDGSPPDLPAELREAILAAATEHAEEDLPVPLLSQRARFWREGDRQTWEQQLRHLGIRTNEAVAATLATGDQRWLDRAADGLLLLCEQSTWCWVAHEQAHRHRGWVVPDLEDPVLDLGAGEVLQVLAWADLALAPALDEHFPGLRERMRREARIRTFEPYLRRRDWFWLHGRIPNNWTGWVHQNLVAGALLLLDGEEDRPMRDAVLALSLTHLDRYLEAFPSDGGIDEGYTYFWVGACRLLEAIEMLVAASGGELAADSVARVPVVRELLRFPQRMELGDGWYVNHSDAPARPEEYEAWHVIHRWGCRLGDAESVAGALARRGDGAAPAIIPQVGLHRLLSSLGDAAWIAARAEPSPLPRETWLSEIEVLVARERAGDASGLVLAAKGGHNAESHNHLDVGSVMVALDSSPVLIDLGQPTYEAKTFSDRRYEIWTMQSSWHTLPTVRGLEEGVGEEYRAHIEGVELIGENQSGDTALSVDLTKAYPPEAGLVRLRRRTSLRRDPSPRQDPSPNSDPVLHSGDPADQSDLSRRDPATRGAEVLIENSWDLGTDSEVHDAGAGIVFHHVLAGEILDQGEGTVRVRALSGAEAVISWDPAAATAELESREVLDPRLQRSWGEVVHRLLLTPSSQNATGSLDVRVRRAG